jgi:hypothetical protein
MEPVVHRYDVNMDTGYHSLGATTDQEIAELDT